jgi:hypothetical protein
MGSKGDSAAEEEKDLGMDIACGRRLQGVN